MPKNAVYDPTAIFDISHDAKVKQIALTFDKIYLQELILEGNPDTDESFRRIGIRESSRVTRQDSMLAYLIDSKVISLYKGREFDQRGPGAFEKIFDYLEGDQIPLNTKQTFRKGASDLLLDLIVREDAARLATLWNEEFYPILRSDRSFQEEGRKTEVVRFIHQQIPMPSLDIPWEAIIEFRNDESVRLKYLALMDWVNGIATTTYSINEIRDKFEYLFLQYKKAFELHKLKASFSILEVLVSVGIGILTSDYKNALNIVSNFIKIGTATVNLIQEESQLPGKEIAYIYHTRKTFNEQ